MKFSPSTLLSITFFSLVLFTWNCSSHSAPPGVDAVIEYTVEKGDSDKTIATLHIKGMMCEMACGGKISKELATIPGVQSANIDFSETRNTDLAIVEIDPELVNAETLVNTVNKIADGKLYNVERIEVVKYEVSEKETSLKNEDPSAYEMDHSLSITNIFTILSNLLR